MDIVKKFSKKCGDNRDSPACQEEDTISGAGVCPGFSAIDMNAELTREHEGVRAVDSESYRNTQRLS